MTDIPFKQTRRWEDLKFIYTQDDETNIVTSQRISKDINGDPVLPPNPLLLSRKIADKKTKFWGKPTNLRKLEVTYEESKNQNGKAQITRYCPYNPSSNMIVDFTKEIFTICKNKFVSSNTDFCVDYKGENRFTKMRPQKTFKNN